LSDKRFVKPALKHALLQSKFTPVYLYQFSFVGTRSAGRPAIPGKCWFSIPVKPQLDFIRMWPSWTCWRSWLHI